MARPPSIPCLLLFHAPTCLHTLAPNGHERLRIVIVHAHTVVPQKRSSNPAFPCSASRIKAFSSSPMKLPDSLYRDADRRWFTQGVSFRTGHQTGKWQSQIKSGFGATNLLDFRQRAIDAQSVGNRCDALCSVGATEAGHSAECVAGEVQARQPACDGDHSSNCVCSN